MPEKRIRMLVQVCSALHGDGWKMTQIFHMPDSCSLLLEQTNLL